MKKFLVVGNPIEHSLSPELHNYWIKNNNINAIYEKQKLDNNELKNLQQQFLSNYMNQSDSLVSVISILKVSHENKPALFDLFEGNENVIIFDKQYFSNQFFDVLREDFDKLVSLSFIIVFFASSVCA